MIQRVHRGPGYRSVSDSLVSPAYSIPNRPWSRRSGGAADAGLAPLMLGLCLDGRQTRFSLMSGEPAGKSLFVVLIFDFLFFFFFSTWKVKLFLGLGSCQLFSPRRVSIPPWQTYLRTVSISGRTCLLLVSTNYGAWPVHRGDWCTYTNPNPLTFSPWILVVKFRLRRIFLH